jgi:hypothetical protein
MQVNLLSLICFGGDKRVSVDDENLRANLRASLPIVDLEAFPIVYVLAHISLLLTVSVIFTTASTTRCLSRYARVQTQNTAN